MNGQTYESRLHLLQKILQRRLVTKHQLIKQCQYITHILAVCTDVHQYLQGSCQVRQHPVAKTLHLQKAKAQAKGRKRQGQRQGQGKGKDKGKSKGKGKGMDKGKGKGKGRD